MPGRVRAGRGEAIVMGRSRSHIAFGVAFFVAVVSLAPGALRASTGASHPAVTPDIVTLRRAPREPRPGRVQPLTAVERAMRALYPKQYDAGESNDPKTRAWALLIGINAYAGRTEDAVGSRQDAQALKRYLVSLGWRTDHIMLITDERATASKILAGIRWLRSKTSSKSTVLFHFAGHEMPRYDDPDRDGEYRDVELWGSDNRFVIDRTLGRELGAVRAARMWIHLATCRAAGFDDAGMQHSGRIITYSSAEPEFSYEDPDAHHSVFGYYTIVAGMTKKYADSNRDGRVAVEEAFGWARARVVDRTDGRQHPKLVDLLRGWFYLDFPKPKKSPPPKRSPQPDGTLRLCATLICT